MSVRLSVSKEIRDAVATETSHLLNASGQRLFCKSWRPKDREPRAILFLSHGLAEHCLSYEPFAIILASRGVAVYAHDHLGHGQSDGSRVLIDTFDRYVQDVLQHLHAIQDRHTQLPLFLMGHSMGGTISVQTAMKRPSGLKGIILTAPALAPNNESVSPFRIKVTKLLAQISPHFPVGRVDFSLATRSSEAIRELKKDPLNCHGMVKAGWVRALLNAVQEININVNMLECPLLVIHGDADKVVHVNGAKLLYNNAPSKDKTIKIYPKTHHNLLYEPEGIPEQVLQDILQWLLPRIGAHQEADRLTVTV